MSRDFFYPHRNCAGWCKELRPSVFVNCYFSFIFFKQVDKYFTGIPFTNLHRFIAVITVSKNNGATAVLVIALPSPTNAIGMIKIIPLCSISVVLAGFQQKF